ncbi:hypothetical protein GCAAIG_04955 [Candidatus Electronema halotolerans]
MNITLHKRARTTPAIRREIQQSTLSERKLAAEYGISRDTVRKWNYLETVEDYSHTPHNLNTSLTSFQEGAGTQGATAGMSRRLFKQENVGELGNSGEQDKMEMRPLRLEH